MVADIRRDVGREYGFRQSAYINFKVVGGYFFCLYFMDAEARLTVKPMYADDLWWDIWDAADNKQEPLSLRGKGAFSLPGQVVESFTALSDDNAYSPDEVRAIVEKIFESVAVAIDNFLSANPDADAFLPDEVRMDHDPDRLLYIIALLHSGRESEALDIIADARKNRHRCMFRSGWFDDSYSYIRRWCSDSYRVRATTALWRKLRRLRGVRHFSEKICKSASEHESSGRRYRWVRYLYVPGYIRWILYILAVILVVKYFFDLDRRTLYTFPDWTMFVGPLFSGLLFVFIVLIGRARLKDLFGGTLISMCVGMVIGGCFIAVGCVAFDVINRLFADREVVTVQAVVTSIKHYEIGHRSRSRYYTVVDIPAEDRDVRIDDARLFKIPAGDTVSISYRRGLFGFSIIDNIDY